MPALPAQPGPLIGRAAELTLVGNRLSRTDTRLVTLTGPAGTGKTRLALEVARRAAENFVDGTFFVDLAPVSDPVMVPSAVAKVLDVREQGDRPLIDLLKERLSTRNTLLVLDNFEQVLGAAPHFSDVLQACERLKLLVTSRSALRLRWEHVIPVEPLAVPNLVTLPEPEGLLEIPSVALFVQRAQRVDPHFALTGANAAAVAAVCVQLDGLPLAIELAAARSRVLPPHGLLSRLEHRLDVLATRSTDQPARQRTLRAALDWSYELLSPAEQAIFRRLGVFVGGFPLSAVGEVCDPDGSLPLDALSAIEALVDNSLVRQEAQTGTLSGEEPRFSMLETMREYALERLGECGELDLTRRRHAGYYLLGADVPVAEMKMPQQSAWLQMLDAEYDNLLTALRWCEEAREPELGLGAAGLLGWFWMTRGYVTEGRQRLAALLSLEASPAVRAEALRQMGALALHQADYQAGRNFFEECLAIRRELGNPAGFLAPLTGLGAVAMQMGDLGRAAAYFEDALAIQTSLGDAVGIAESLNNLGNIAHDAGQFERARELYERSLSVQITGGLRYRTDVVTHNLGVIALEQGDLAAARRHLEDSVAVRRALADASGLALSLAKLGEVLSASGEASAAHRVLAESLTLQRELGDRAGIAFVLERLAMATAARGQLPHALRLAAGAQSLREAIGTPQAPAARSNYDQWLSSVRNALRPEQVTAAWEAGKALALQQVLDEAQVVEAQDAEAAPAPRTTTGLSAREREVAVLVAQGLTNREIAGRLVVSERTAENHVQHVLNRLGLRSRAQVAAWAVQNGLLS